MAMSPYISVPDLTEIGLRTFYRNRVLYVTLLLPVIISCCRQVYVLISIPGFNSLLTYGYYGSLFIAAAYSLYSARSRLHGRTALFIVSCLPGVLLSFYQEEALQRYLGLVLLIAAVGPLFSGSKCARLRLMGWITVLVFAIFVSVASVFWRFLPLPSIGLGLFSGATPQPKTLAFNSVLAVIVLASFITQRNWKLAFPVLMTAILVTVLTGSRASLVAIIVSMAIIIYIRRAVGIAFLTAGLISSLVLLSQVNLQSIVGSKTVSWYAEKGLSDTRSHLWQMRLKDYSSSPVFGVGVGVASEILRDPTLQDMSSGVAFFDENGRLVFEPGSSWLAVLSMTGLSGSLAFLLLLVQAVRSCLRYWKRAALQVYALQMATGAFFTLQFIEGGFVLSFGNPHTLYFWLWLGVTLHGKYFFSKVSDGVS